MKQKPPLIVLATAFLVLLSHTSLYAQVNPPPPPSSEPSWIKMMDDSNVNFFVIEKSFNDYWSGREKPVEEDEVLDVKNNSERKRGFLGLFRKKETEKEREKEKRQIQQYAFEYKKYMWWRRQVLPYVQPDGRILTNQEQLNIWHQQKQAKTNMLRRQFREKKNTSQSDSTRTQ